MEPNEDRRRPPDDGGVVLIYAPDGRNCSLIADLLERAGIATYGCPDPDAFQARLHASADELGAVILTERARSLGADTAIERFQRIEPAWSALPVVLLTDAAPTARPPWRNAVQIRQPTSGRQLLDVLEIALDGRRRQRALAEANRRLRHMAFHDVLTGLPNRAALFDVLQRLQGERRHERGGFSVLFLDVDRFKFVNDTHGHAAGDELLRAVAATVTAAVREEDVVARLAGDEFIVVLTGTESVARARAVAQRLSRETTVHLESADADVVLSLSVGVLEDVGVHDDPDHIIAWADARMYEHKVSKPRAARAAGVRESG